MATPVMLYEFASDGIKISIEARFDGEDLVIDGYDIGKVVKEYWGDSDYEYTTTVHAQNVPKLREALNLRPGEKQVMLEELARRFNTNSCYSEFRKFLEQHNIPSEGFSWT